MITNIQYFGQTSPFFKEKKDKETYFSVFQKQLEENKKTISLQRIESRLKLGEKLSCSEKRYLKENAPDLYEKALKIEKEREEHRRALNRCKTTEEAKAYHMARTQSLMIEAGIVSSNPNIPKDKKMEMLEFISMRSAALQDEYKKNSCVVWYELV